VRFAHQLGRDFGILDVDAILALPYPLIRRWAAFYSVTYEDEMQAAQQARAEARLKGRRRKGKR